MSSNTPQTDRCERWKRSNRQQIMANFEFFSLRLILQKLRVWSSESIPMSQGQMVAMAEDGLGGYGPFSGEFFRSYRMEFTSQGSSTLGRPQVAWAFWELNRQPAFRTKPLHPNPCTWQLLQVQAPRVLECNHRDKGQTPYKSNERGCSHRRLAS